MDVVASEIQLHCNKNDLLKPNSQARPTAKPGGTKKTKTQIFGYSKKPIGKKLVPRKSVEAKREFVGYEGNIDKFDEF